MDEKLIVNIFVPTHQCACNFSHFIDRVFKTVLPFREKVYIDTKDSESELGQRLNISRYSVVVMNPPNEEKPIIFTNTSQFQTFLQNNFLLNKS